MSGFDRLLILQTSTLSPHARSGDPKDPHDEMGHLLNTTLLLWEQSIRLWL